MRVGILSYPMLFQRDGGLQVQIRETIAALNALPDGRVEAALVDPQRERLDSFDLVHVYSAINGNHRIMETASEMGVPVVLSPLLAPGWDRAAGLRAHMAERLAGRLTSWNAQTTFSQTKRALQLADRIVALGEAEKKAIVEGFRVDAHKIHLLPNGISAQFFAADEALFRQQTAIEGPFVLMVGAISPYKNQLALARELAGSGLGIVLIGQAQSQHQGYLQELLTTPQVSWLGQLQHDDPLLASAYRAASVLALPSQGEVFPLSVLEALSTGTPAVMTDESALRITASEFALKHMRWKDTPAIARAVRELLAHPPERAKVQALVARFTWQRVAAELAQCYAAMVEA